MLLQKIQLLNVNKRFFWFHLVLSFLAVTKKAKENNNFLDICNIRITVIFGVTLSDMVRPLHIQISYDKKGKYHNFCHRNC